MKIKKIILAAIVVYILLMVVYAKAVNWATGDPAKAGQFGDMFGCFTALINGLAVIGVVYTISLQNSAHVVATLDILHRRWNETAMLRTRRRTCERILEIPEKSDFTFSQSMQHVAEYFEHMGVLVKLQAIDSIVIWQLYSWYIESYWGMFEKRIKEIRHDNKDISAYSEFEGLYLQMKKITERKNLPSFDKSPAEVREFARSDKKLAERLLAIQSEADINIPHDQE